jgi:hypothetical protein
VSAPTIARADLLDGLKDADLRRLTLDAMATVDRPRRLDNIRAAGADIADRWLDFGLENRVAPVVAHALLDAFGDDFLAATRAKTLHDHELRRMGIMLAALDRIAARLATVGIRMVGLKNAGIARGVFDCPGCCPMGDLDVLVDRARFREAHQLILDEGFVLATRGTVESADLEEGLEHGGTEYVAQIDGEEVWFELQWRPIAGRWIRRDQEPDGAELIARSVPIEGTDVRLLAPADNMIQVALHTAKHTYVRAPGLRLHTDVDRLAQSQTPDWHAVVELATTLEVKTATFFSFALARALLDTDVPDHVLESLAPPLWKVTTVTNWLRRIDVFYPDARKFRRPDMIAFTALMYDDVVGLTASVLDAERDELRWTQLPRHLRRGVARVKDLVTRYER